MRLLQPLRHEQSISTVQKRRQAGNNVSNEVFVQRKRGRPRKDAVPLNLEETVKRTQKQSIQKAKSSPKTISEEANDQPASHSSPAKRAKTRKLAATQLPARIVQTLKHHNDLSSFLAYAARTNLNTSTNVYKGTLYEYTVAASLAPFNFALHRTGRSNDLGIDLLGHFKLPHATKQGMSATHELRVLVQCKAVKPTPSMVRELEGAYVGAPAGWRGESVLALLVANKEATKGVRDALQRSRWPMALLQVTDEGEVRQFLWNPVAAQIGLEGLGVTVRYAESKDCGTKTRESENDRRQVDHRKKVKNSIALTWMGRLWRTAESNQ